ncbi:MAG: hypothetical protein U0L10_08520, partial [Lachnospiraceae bacterium]|nr:hypothetical protein [Lachnospiraceae bacterium]
FLLLLACHDIRRDPGGTLKAGGGSAPRYRSGAAVRHGSGCPGKIPAGSTFVLTRVNLALIFFNNRDFRPKEIIFPLSIQICLTGSRREPIP